MALKRRQKYSCRRLTMPDNIFLPTANADGVCCNNCPPEATPCDSSPSHSRVFIATIAGLQGPYWRFPHFNGVHELTYQRGGYWGSEERNLSFSGGVWLLQLLLVYGGPIIKLRFNFGDDRCEPAASSVFVYGVDYCYSDYEDCADQNGATCVLS